MTRPPVAGSIHNVQALRAIAALLVVGVHIISVEKRFTPSNVFFANFYPIGEWGVDLFFVISGFVMITSTWDEFATRAASLRFFLRRLTRIYPTYWIAMIPIVMIFVFAPHMVNGSQEIRPSVVASLLLLPQAGKPLLTVSWTLVYEMFFYVVFAIVLAFDRRFCLPLVTAWGTLTLLVSALARPLHNLDIDTYSNPIVIEFIFGVFAGYLFKERGTVMSIAALVAGLLGVAAAQVWYEGFNTSAGLGGDLRFVCVGVPVLLIFIGTIGCELRYGLLLPQFLARLGNASFSLYLWHVPLTIFIGRLSAGSWQTNPVAHGIWLAGMLVAVVAASVALYELVERPVLRFFGRLLGSLDGHALRGGVPVNSGQR